MSETEPEPGLIVDESRVESFLPLLGYEVNESGEVASIETGEIATSPDGEVVLIDELGYLGVDDSGELELVPDSMSAIVEYLSDDQPWDDPQDIYPETPEDDRPVESNESPDTVSRSISQDQSTEDVHHPPHIQVDADYNLDAYLRVGSDADAVRMDRIDASEELVVLQSETSDGSLEVYVGWGGGLRITAEVFDEEYHQIGVVDCPHDHQQADGTRVFRAEGSQNTFSIELRKRFGNRDFEGSAD